MKVNLTLGFINWDLNNVNVMFSSSLIWKLRILLYTWQQLFDSRFMLWSSPQFVKKRKKKDKRKNEISKRGKITFYVMYISDDNCVWRKGKHILKLQEYGAWWCKPIWNGVRSARLFSFCNHRDGCEYRHCAYMTGDFFADSISLLYTHILHLVCPANVSHLSAKWKIV
jgi:hypothetical protein